MTDDLISRQAAIEAVMNHYRVGDKPQNEEMDWCVKMLNELPTAEPEIIKCRECLMHGVCRFEQGLGLDGYCSQAERKSDG